MPDQEALLKAIDAAEQNAYGSEIDYELQSDRALAIDYYLGRNVEPADEGRSQVVDRSVFETIQWILPSLIRIFANGDDVVELAPFGPEDEESAKQESSYLNYVVTQKNPWFETVQTWFTDALLTSNAYCMAQMEEVTRTEKERYEMQSQEQVALLAQDGEIISIEEVPDPDGGVEVVMDDLGQPTQVPRTLFNLEVRKSTPDKKMCFRVLPPERCKVSEHTPDWTLEECPYFEYWDYETISSLRAQGFDIDDDIAGDHEDETEEDYARDRYIDEVARNDDNEVDPSLRRVKVRNVWIRYDYDEDGIAELQRCIVVGREVLFREEEARIPVACITPSPLTHRHQGLSIADMVMDVQRVKTAILRAGLDNLYQSNNGRTAISEKVNLDDLLVSRPGGIVRVDGGIPQQEIMQFQAPFIFPQAMEGLEYMDRVNESRSGVNRNFTGLDENALSTNQSGVAINQLSTMAAQRVEQIARIFASGVEYLFSVAHELILKHGHKREVVQLRGQWTEIDPTTWKTGRDMRVVVGFGAGNKDTLLQRLVTMVNLQKELMQLGSAVATEQNLYESLIELTKAADFTAPQRFWTDPATVQRPPPPPSQEEVFAQIESQKIQSNEKTKTLEVQQREADSVRDAQLLKYKTDVDAQVKIMLEQARAGEKVDAAALKELSRSDGPIKLDIAAIEETNQFVSALIESQKEQTVQFQNMLASMASQITEVVSKVSAPKEVIRDGSGKVTGVRTVESE